VNSRGGASRPLNGYEFIICCGYKGYVIKEYFVNYFLHTSDVTFDMSTKEALGNKVVKRSLRSDLFLMNVLGAD
jgi:NDP-sugar pyrophosphorylase family protein